MNQNLNDEQKTTIRKSLFEHREEGKSQNTNMPKQYHMLKKKLGEKMMNPK
jgi:hypothetical protein